MGHLRDYCYGEEHIPNDNFTAKEGALGCEWHFCCIASCIGGGCTIVSESAASFPGLHPSCCALYFIRLFSYCQVGAGSQALLDNAERYGLYLASAINDSSIEMIFSRPNIGECCIIVTLYENEFFILQVTSMLPVYTCCRHM